MFENMSDSTQTHAPVDVHSIVCFIYLKSILSGEKFKFSRGE